MPSLKRVAPTINFRLDRAVVALRQHGDEEEIAATLKRLAATILEPGHDDQAITHFVRRGPVMSEAQRVRGMLLNDAGHRAMKQGQIDAALGLFQRSLKICQRIGDHAGEVTALENTYLAYRAAQRYTEALGMLETIWDALFHNKLHDKIENYLHEIAASVAFLAEHEGMCIVRERYYEQDLQHCLEAHGAGLRESGVLIIEEDQDVLEVMAYTSRDERIAFLERIREKLPSNPSQLDDENSAM